MVFGRLNFQTVGCGRVITQRQRRDWFSPPLCLCKYSCPCHTEVPSKQTPTPRHFTTLSSPTASSPNSFTAINHTLRYIRRTHLKAQPETLKSHERSNTIPHSEKFSEDVPMCRWTNRPRRFEGPAFEDETTTKSRDVCNQ